MMDSIKNIQELRTIPTTYKQVFQNTFSNSIDKTKIVTAKYNGAITDRDIAIIEFLFRFRFATLEQIYRYLELTNNLGDEGSMSAIKSRLERLIKMYKAVNKFVLSPYDCVSFDSDNLDFYCLDLGGAFLLHNFTNQTLDDIRNWRPKNANIHTVEAVCRDIRIVDFYLTLLDTFGDELIHFEPYKRMSYDKRQLTVTFDFCVSRDGDTKYFIGEIIRDEELVSRFANSADAIEQIVSTNAWKKYYLDIDVPPVLLYFVDDDDSALEVSQSLALRKIDKFRITTVDRVAGDLSTAFMVYDKESGELKLGKSKFFEKNF